MNKHLLYPRTNTMLQLVQTVAQCKEPQCSHCPLVLELNVEATNKPYSIEHTQHSTFRSLKITASPLSHCSRTKCEWYPQAVLHYAHPTLPIGGVPGTGFGNNASTLKQYFVLPKNGSKSYLKYTFLAFPVLGILGLGTPLLPINGNS